MLENYKIDDHQKKKYFRDSITPGALQRDRGVPEEGSRNVAMPQRKTRGTRKLEVAEAQGQKEEQEERDQEQG